MLRYFITSPNLTAHKLPPKMVSNAISQRVRAKSGQDVKTTFAIRHDFIRRKNLHASSHMGRGVEKKYILKVTRSIRCQKSASTLTAFQKFIRSLTRKNVDSKTQRKMPKEDKIGEQLDRSIKELVATLKEIEVTPASSEPTPKSTQRLPSKKIVREPDTPEGQPLQFAGLGKALSFDQYMQWEFLDKK